MNTKFNLLQDLSIETSAVIVEDSDISYPGETVKVYIPSLMVNIKKGEPCTSIASSQGYMIFKNDKQCRPRNTSNVLKQQNYLDAVLLNNSNINVIKKEKETGEKYIPYGTVIRTEFSNGKLSKLCFNTDNYKGIVETDNGSSGTDLPYLHVGDRLGIGNAVLKYEHVDDSLIITPESNEDFDSSVPFLHVGNKLGIGDAVIEYQYSDNSLVFTDE